MLMPNPNRPETPPAMKKLSLTLLTSLLLAAALLYCTSPTEPVFDNPYDPYDEESGAYIPTPDLNTAPVQPLATAAITGGVFETNFGRPVTKKGVCWSTSENPTIEDNCSDEGPGTQPFETLIEGLDVTTRYYVRAYAINDAGTIYGGQRSFKTRDGVPTVVTTEPFNIALISARTGGTITDDGGADITEAGVCYVQGDGIPDISDTCVSGIVDSDSFIVLLENLVPGETYSVRAYANTQIATAWANLYHGHKEIY